MTDQAGPSILKQSKKPRRNVKHGLRPAKAKRLSEKQQIEALERAVMEFVSYSSYCTAERNSISSASQEPRDDLKAFSDLPISDFSKKGVIYISPNATDMTCFIFRTQKVVLR